MSKPQMCKFEKKGRLKKEKTFYLMITFHNLALKTETC